MRWEALEWVKWSWGGKRVSHRHKTTYWATTASSSLTKNQSDHIHWQFEPVLLRRGKRERERKIEEITTAAAFIWRHFYWKVILNECLSFFDGMSVEEACGCICGSLVTCNVANQTESFALCSAWHRNFSLSSFLQSTRPNPWLSLKRLISIFIIIQESLYADSLITSFPTILHKSINNLTSVLFPSHYIHIHKYLQKAFIEWDRKEVEFG